MIVCHLGAELVLLLRGREGAKADPDRGARAGLWSGLGGEGGSGVSGSAWTSEVAPWTGAHSLHPPPGSPLFLSILPHVIPPSPDPGAPLVLLLSSPSARLLPHLIRGGLVYLMQGPGTRVPGVAMETAAKGERPGLVAMPICSRTVLMASTCGLFSLSYSRHPSPEPSALLFITTMAAPPAPPTEIAATGFSETHSYPHVSSNCRRSPTSKMRSACI